MPNKGGMKRKKKRTQKGVVDAPVDDKTPRCFVLHLGDVSRVLEDLQHDLRAVMEPNTASRLKQRRSNRMKDFLMVASTLGVSHVMALSSTKIANYLKVSRFPRGPTLHFRITSFSLIRDIHNMQKKPIPKLGPDYNFSPLVVLNNFGSGKDQPQHLKLISVMFQNMFPAINVKTVRLNECRRVVLLNYDAKKGRVVFRHYAIRLNPRGLTKGVKRLVQEKVPNLKDFQDVSDYVLRASHASESDIEDSVDARVQLPDSYTGKGVETKASECAVRLTELGPRMELELVKIEDGLFAGDIIYHRFVKKTAKEAAELKRRKAEERKLKEERRAEQQRNVDAKKAKRMEKLEARKQRREERIKRQMEEQEEELAGSSKTKQATNRGKQVEDDSDDNDSSSSDGDSEIEYDEEYESQNAFEQNVKQSSSRGNAHTDKRKRDQVNDEDGVADDSSDDEDALDDDRDDDDDDSDDNNDASSSKRSAKAQQRRKQKRRKKQQRK